MKRGFKSFCGLLLAAAMCVTVFAACGKTETPPADDKGCGLTISASEMTMNVDTQKQLTASTNDNSKYTLVWSSSDDSVASVSDGLVSAHSAGNAVITVGARAKGSATVIEKKTCTVTVVSRKVILDRKAAVIDMNKESVVTIAATVEGGTDPVAWKSGDESIATVADGVVTGRKTGTTVITATSGDLIAECRITVVNKQTVERTKTLTLSSTLTSPEWASDNKDVASVSGGVVTGAAVGTATITASNGNNAESYIVNVVEKTEEGQTYVLEAGNKAAAAENPGKWNYLLESNVAKVSEIPYCDGGIIVMDITDIGESGANFAYLRYQPDTVGGVFYKTHLYFYAGDDAVVAINGVDTNISKGANRLTVDYTSKKPSAKDTFQFKFRTATSFVIAAYFEESEPEAQLTLDKTELELLTVEGQNTATLTPKYVEGATFEWSSSDESVATVSNGVVTAVGDGTATITCYSDGKQATCVVTVKSTAVTLSEKFVTLYLNDETAKEHNLTATASDGSAVTWSSSDAETVSVANGKITALKKGWATVFARTEGGAVGECVVFVTDTEKQYGLTEGKNDGVPNNPGVWYWAGQAGQSTYDNGTIKASFESGHTAISGNNTFMLRYMPFAAGKWKITFTLKITCTGANADDVIKTEFKGTGAVQEYTVAELAEGIELTDTFDAANASGKFFQLKISGIASEIAADIEVSQIRFVPVA